MYINTTTLQYPIQEYQIREQYPNTSFAIPFIPPEPYAVVFQSPRPEYNPQTHSIKEIAPELTAKGHWEQRWEVVELPQEEVETNAARAALAMQQAIINAMSQLFDSTAQARRYDNRVTCALRAGYPGPFQAEGQAFATWMDTCNALGYQMLAEVEAGTRPMPASVQEALDLLPEMVWPT